MTSIFIFFIWVVCGLLAAFVSWLNSAQRLRDGEDNVGAGEYAMIAFLLGPLSLFVLILISGEISVQRVLFWTWITICVGVLLLKFQGYLPMLMEEVLW